MNDNVAIEIEDVHYAYPDGTQALNGISLCVRTGERVGLIGANGSGKSTLLLHLNGILRGRGSVRVLGQPVDGSNLKEIRQKVGLVFQDPDDQLFCPTVFDDVAFGPSCAGLRGEALAERVREGLAAVGLSGYEERSAFHLSAGEKKRVSLATVLAMRPEILALDEPTSDLDPRRRREILELLLELGGTQVIATHDLAFAGKLCQRCILLDGGRVAAEGAAADILGDGGLLERHSLA
jgi:cobalt/nickel transport system ATP-binding protein